MGPTAIQLQKRGWNSREISSGDRTESVAAVVAQYTGVQMKVSGMLAFRSI